MLKRVILFSGLLLTLLACANNKKINQQKETMKTKGSLDPTESLAPAPAPGNVIATVKVSDFNEDSGKHTCTITISSVKAYGSTTTALDNNTQIQVNIAGEESLIRELKSLSSEKSVSVVLSYTITRSGSNKSPWTIISLATSN